jgi:hypothetical protein
MFWEVLYYSRSNYYYPISLRVYCFDVPFGKQNQIGVRMPKTISAWGKMICKTHQFLQRENGNENSSYQS